MHAQLVVPLVPVPLAPHSPGAVVFGMIVLTVLAVACLGAVIGRMLHIRFMDRHGPKRSR